MTLDREYSVQRRGSKYPCFTESGADFVKFLLETHCADIPTPDSVQPSVRGMMAEAWLYNIGLYRRVTADEPVLICF
jgi:hypothetical protein